MGAKAARAAAPAWSTSGIQARSDALDKIGNEILARREELGTLLSGAVLTEQVFTIPGFGKLIVDSVFNRDFAVVQGVVLVTATAYITLSLLADLAYFAVNPRLRA